MISKSIDYCSEPIENIENYEEAIRSEEMWEIHHRLEIDSDGHQHTPKELIARGLYYDRPANELIFLTRKAHRRLHAKAIEIHERLRETSRNAYESWRGKKHSDSARVKMSVKARIRGRKVGHAVRMTRISDGFTKVFASQKEAAAWLRENGFPKACSVSVGRCCRGLLGKCYGANWTFIE